MTEAAFPILGAAFVLMCVLPVFSLLAKGVLSQLERERGACASRSRPALRAAHWCAASCRIVWFFSAGLHQVWSGGSALVCLLDHGSLG
jgi:hypothetical protein